MMKSIVEEKRISFKTLEQKIFRYVCDRILHFSTAYAIMPVGKKDKIYIAY